MAWNIDNSIIQDSSVSKPLVSILMPHTGSLTAEFIDKMWIPLRTEKAPWFDKIYFLCRVPSLPLARNILVQNMLKTDATHVLWIDSDMLMESIKIPNERGEIVESINPNHAIKIMLDLCNDDAPIITGLYRAKQVHGFNWAIWKRMRNPETNKIGYIHVSDWSGNWFEVDVAGCGFTLMKREVYDFMQSPWFHWEVEGEMSEDFYMFEKAKRLGFKVWCYTDIRLSHIGQMVVCTGDVSEGRPNREIGKYFRLLNM